MKLIQQLPVEEKRAVLETLTAEQESWWEETVKGEPQLRRLCAERGRDWDRMGEKEREEFIGDPIHEDR